MEKIVDLEPFFKPTFLKDMKTGCTLHLSQRFENTSEYEVSELCRFLPEKDQILTRSEMLEYFSEIIVYLLDKGFTIRFKDGWKELGDSLEIIVVDGNRKQNYILRDELSMFSENPITPETAFKNFYVDTILLSLEITANYHRVLFEILESVYNPQN